MLHDAEPLLSCLVLLSCWPARCEAYNSRLLTPRVSSPVNARQGKYLLLHTDSIILDLLQSTAAAASKYWKIMASSCCKHNAQTKIWPKAAAVIKFLIVTWSCLMLGACPESKGCSSL